MPAITVPPTAAYLASISNMFQSPFLNDVQRMATLIQARIVLLNYKGGTNYIGNHRQLMQDALTAFKGFTPEQWGFTLGKAGYNLDPGPVIVGAYWTQANYHDSTNMPSTWAAISTLLGEQMFRPMELLALQNVYLTYLLLAYV